MDNSIVESSNGHFDSVKIPNSDINTLDVVNKNKTYPQCSDDFLQIINEVTEIKNDISTMTNAYKQREKSEFNDSNIPRGQSENSDLWKSEKLSTNAVDNFYDSCGKNIIMASMRLKSQILKGLQDDNENMFFALLLKKDFLCEGKFVKIILTKELAEIVNNRKDDIEKYASGFTLSVHEIEIITNNIHVEIEKLKKFFGDIIKIIT